MRKTFFGAVTLAGFLLLNGCASSGGEKAAADAAEAKSTAERALKAAEEAKAEAAAAKGMAQDAMNAAQQAKDEARSAMERADRMFKGKMQK